MKQPGFPNTSSVDTFKHMPSGSGRSPGAITIHSSDVLFSVLKVLPQLWDLDRKEVEEGAIQRSGGMSSSGRGDSLFKCPEVGL